MCYDDKVREDQARPLRLRRPRWGFSRTRARTCACSWRIQARGEGGFAVGERGSLPPDGRPGREPRASEGQARRGGSPNTRKRQARDRAGEGREGRQAPESRSPRTFVESGDYVDEGVVLRVGRREARARVARTPSARADAIGSASRRTSGTRTTRSSRATTTERTRWRTRAGCCTARRRTSTACC